MWQNYLIVSGAGEKENKYTAALILQCVGKEALRVHNAMMFNVTTDDKDNPQDIIKKM